jgi:glucose/arabinose dehydrogenase
MHFTIQIKRKSKMLILCVPQSRQRLGRKVFARLISLLALFTTVMHFEVLSTPALAIPSAAFVETKLKVPISMTYKPFNINRYLKVPPNFSISVYARIKKARFMAVAPNDDLLVSQPSTGKVLLVRRNGSKDPIISDFVTGLRKPHDIVFHKINNTTYIYISETHQINRFIYKSGNTAAQNRQVVVAGLPDASTRELKGSYGHELKNIALDANHKLYVSIASSCNACLSDTVSNPKRGAIYQYNADGTNGRLFAQGLRNAEGLAFVPGTNDLWVTVMNRDNVAYPFKDATGNYGKIIPSYVDNHPPDEFTNVRDGGNYGWPFCNSNPYTSNGFNNMPFERDYEFNADGRVNCNAMDKIKKGMQAHSAPLGLTFLQNTNFPSLYSNGALVGLHGSWNRQKKTGYAIAYFPWNSRTNLPGNQMDLVSGWLVAATQEVWGRPVDTVVDQQGNLLISDDYGDAIYKLSYTPPG